MNQEFVTQVDFAARVGCSKQYVNKLVKQNRLPVDHKKRIELHSGLEVYWSDKDPSKIINKAPPPVEQTAAPVSVPAVESGYQKARTEREEYQAKQAKLDFEERVGELVSRKFVLGGLIDSGRKIRKQLDALPEWADELFSIAAGGGSAEDIRKALKTKVRDLEQNIADVLGNTPVAGSGE